ncbi:MAG TPA: TlyA family RNA methyltransferase [Acidimicrobiales bacterium]|nr:TlyA family RNA methyltransferase [Acidimicrobiales bacterium]
MRRRLDTELVRRGLVSSRTSALAEIQAGRVTVAGAPATKAAHLVAAGQPIEVLGPPSRFVSRGGIKLDAALEHFSLDVTGARGLDAGSSTGGFTDCLLQRGASRVVAIDVGYGQLHERLRGDPRVEVRERTDIRSITVDDVGGFVDVVVADLSFISLRAVLGSLLALATPGAAVVTLVKPQFEAGRREASRGKGVVRDPLVWRRVLGEVVVAVEALGAALVGATVSPITGAQGNVEFLVHLVRPEHPSVASFVIDLDAVVEEAVRRHLGRPVA